MTENISSRLCGDHLTLAYDTRVVVEDLSLAVPDGLFSVIIGPNACGKSTVLRALARLSQPKVGCVQLDGALISSYPTREVARRLGLLPQSALAPEGITVIELVSRGRHPHRGLFGQWTADDNAAVARALRATDIQDLADRAVDALSGGQRQRVWVAMVLAQNTPLILLDEPTTFLDVAHQFDLLELFRRLNREQGHTLVAVLHDLNQACRYADHLVVMRAGQIVAQGAPQAIVTPELIEQVFDLPCLVMPDPVAGTPMIVPLGRRNLK